MIVVERRPPRQGRAWIALSVCALVVGGCGGHLSPLAVGAFDTSRFWHASLDYQLMRDRAGELVGPSWELDNFRLDSQRRPTVAKTGPDYVVRRRADTNGDGRVEDFGNVPAYDLRFVSRRDAGTIFVRTIPLPDEMADMELRVLMRFYVEGASGVGIAFSDVGAHRVEVVERHFASRELAARATAIDGREAYESVIEIANVDQLALDPTTRWQRTRVVLVRTDMWMPIAPGRSSTYRRALMIIGYTNLPEDYASHTGEFGSLLSRIRFETDARAAPDALACVPRTSVSFVVPQQRSAIRPLLFAPGSTRDEERCLSDVAVAHHLRSPRAYRYVAPAARFSAPERAEPAPAATAEPAPVPAPESAPQPPPAETSPAAPEGRVAPTPSESLAF